MSVSYAGLGRTPARRHQDAEAALTHWPDPQNPLAATALQRARRRQQHSTALTQSETIATYLLNGNSD
jgi:hypothetical protein